MRAPVDGVIFNPIAFESGVLQSGARILSIVPNKDLYAEVFVPNKDIGFIKIDQSAKVRVNAFPFTRYGEIDATVNQIGADALEPDSIQSFYRFPVKLSLETVFAWQRCSNSFEAWDVNYYQFEIKGQKSY